MTIEEVSLDNIENVDPAKEAKPSYSLQTLVFLINKERVDQLEGNLRAQFKELKTRQEEIKALQSFTRALNTATDNKGNLDISNSEELQEMYEQMNEKFDLTLPEGKTKFVGQERERILENIKMTLDEKNLANDLLMHKIQQLNNERNESFQLAQSITKRQHEIISRQAQALAGR